MIMEEIERLMRSKENQFTHKTGLLVYLAGAFVGFVLLALSVWGEIEASTFGVALSSDERLSSLNCPVFMTRDEVGEISAVFENPTDRDVNPLVRSTITFGFVTLVDERDQRLAIPAGGASELTWEVARENAAYDRLILAHFYQLRNYALPSRQASCGIVVLPVSGLSGDQIFAASFVTSLVLMAAGIWLYAPKGILRYSMLNANQRRQSLVIRAYIFLGTYFLAATLFSLIVTWLVHVLLMVFAIVSILGVFSYALSSRS